MSEFQKTLNLLQNKATRIALCEKSFFHFLIWYFYNSLGYPKLADYHHQRIKTAESGLNLYVEGHRDSAKTTILGIAYECRKICYSKANFLCNLCYDKTKAKAFNFIIANILVSNKRIIDDFGVLYVRGIKSRLEDFLIQSGINEFITTNGIKVKAFGMGEAIRGELYYHPNFGMIRPDHLNIDDIDNNKNTKNVRLIEEDFHFIQEEVFGGLSQEAQIICLGNVIRLDGRNVRIKNTYQDEPDRRTFSNFIYGPAGAKEGTVQRERFVETDNEAKTYNEGKPKAKRKVSLETKKREQKSGFNQNYLGIPMVGAQKFVKLEWLHKIKKSELPEKFDYINIGIDPAFSLKTVSDDIGVVVTGHLKIKVPHPEKPEKTMTKYKKFVLKVRALSGEEKDQIAFENVVIALYHNFNVRRIVIESNNGGETLARGLIRKGLAVDIVHATKDKVTRLKEHEGDLMEGYIFFVEGETEGLIQELVEFTGEEGGQDNLVDAFVRSLKEKKAEIFVG